MYQIPFGLKILAFINFLFSGIFLLINFFGGPFDEVHILGYSVVAILFFFTGIGFLLKHYTLGYVLGNILCITWIFTALYFFESAILIQISYPTILLIFLNKKYKKYFTKYSLLKTENKTYKLLYILFSTLFAVLLICSLSLGIQSNPELFESIRYKDISDWYTDKKLYTFSIYDKYLWVDESSVYKHNISLRKEMKRRIISWGNDTTYLNSIEVDSLLKYSSDTTFIKYDKSIMKITDSLVIPVKFGSTILLYKHPLGFDSADVVIRKKEKEFVHSSSDTFDVISISRNEIQDNDFN